MKPPKPGALNRETVAETIRGVRKSQGLTQEQLAEKAKVSVPSVFRAEKAESVRVSTLKKIAQGLNLGYDALSVGVQRGARIAINRSADAIWNACGGDRRLRAPEDRLVSYRDPNERLRLGRLGFVAQFMSPPSSIMRDGPGLVFIELFDDLEWPFNAEYYKDAVILVLRGTASVQIGDEIVQVSEGDWVGYSSGELVAVRRVVTEECPQFPAVLLWIGANRVTKRTLDE